MEPYIKSRRQRFNDYATEYRYGIGSFGNPYSFVTEGIVDNPMIWTNSLTGVKNPYWRDQVREGIDATTTMVASEKTVKANIMFAIVDTRELTGDPANRSVYEWRGYPYYSDPATVLPDSEVITNTRNRALRKFHSKINQARSSLEGGQTFGEWKQLIQAVTNPVGALRNFTLGHLRRAKKRIRLNKTGRGKLSKEKRIQRLHSVVADTWLEYTFGWNPLASDAAAALVGLQTRFNQNDQVTIDGRAQSAYAGTASRRLQFQRHSGVFQCYTMESTRSTIKIIYRAGLRTGAVNGTKTVDQTFGLLPERFVPTIWELIPYSFVADYFTNIGDIINALATQRSWLTWGCNTTRITHENNVSPCTIGYEPTPAYFASSSTNGYSAYGGDATISYKSVERLPLSQSSLLPDFEISLPVKKKPWINMTALILSRVGR